MVGVDQLILLEEALVNIENVNDCFKPFKALKCFN